MSKSFASRATIRQRLLPCVLAAGFGLFGVHYAAAADLSDLKDAATQSTNIYPPPPPPMPTSPEEYFLTWFQRSNYAKATQPHWMTPLVTVTPRLEQEIRYDQYFEHLGNGADLDNFDSGKGLELIPTTTNEVLINAPPWERRTIVKPASGFGDWPFLTIKQRIISAPEDQGNYILTAFLGVQAPIGAPAFTNGAYVITPTIAGGKGWGDFDIQATIGAPIPVEYESVIGTSLATNVAFQYHIFKYFWPEVELNDTYWFDGLRGGMNQLFVTPGVILGRFELAQGINFIAGMGYQVAVDPSPTKLTPALTPVYDHAWILTTRMAF